MGRVTPPLTRYAGAVVCAAGALLLRFILHPLLGEASFHLFTVAVAAASLWGLGPGLLATLCSAFAGHVLLLHPQERLTVGALIDDPRTLLFAMEGAIVAAVVAAARWRVHAERAEQQERAEQHLKAAGASLRTVLDSALDAVVGMDERGRVTLWNPRAAEIFGWSEKEALGKSMTELVIRPADREALRAAMTDLVTGEKVEAAGRRFELFALRRDRSHFPVELSLSAGRQGQGWQFNAFVSDISDRKAAEARLLEQQKEIERSQARALEAEQQGRREAEEANRMKDEFLATISHELRTPLTAIVGWAQILRTGDLSPEDQERAVTTIDRNARAQAQLIADLLDVSRIITGKLRLDRQPVPPVQVVEAALDTVRPTANGKGVELVAELERFVRPVSGDPHRLQQVVWNLLTNAVKFTPRGGRVRVRLASGPGCAVISVDDTGAGIDPDFVPHVFEPFRQADVSSARVHGGLGLGLAIVRHLVDLHGGTVEAHSEGHGHGSTFTVRLPVTVEAAAAAAGPESPAPAPAEAAVLDGVRVLLVDDDADIREMMRTVLSRRGAEVHVAASAAAALAVMGHERLDVLLSDLEMPEVDGFTLLREARQTPEGKALPAAALTGYARPEDRAEALRAGYQMHLVKPIDPGDLVAAVATLAGRPAAGRPPLAAR